MNSHSLNLVFKLRYLSNVLVGETPDISKDICSFTRLNNKITSVEECKKSIIFTRNIWLRRVIRASSLRGLIRASAEYIVESISRATFNKNAVCSYLNTLHKPTCKIPLEKDNIEMFSKIGWVEIREGKIKYKNYTCLICSFFGTSGLKSLIEITFAKNSLKNFEEVIENVDIKRYLFSHQISDNKRRKLLLEMAKKNSNFIVNVSIRKPLLEKLYVKGESNIYRVGVSLIWLSLLPINAGLIRLGRFKSRGLGYVEIKYTRDTFNKIAGLINTSSFYNVTKRALEIIKSELRARLS